LRLIRRVGSEIAKRIEIIAAAICNDMNVTRRP
jgi:hypothetical protein